MTQPASNSIRARYRALPKWIRAVIIVFISLWLLLLLAYAGLAWYVKSHKKELLADITTKLNEQVDGTLTIGDLEPAFWKNFPNISFRLRNVKLSDSLVKEHKHPLLDIGDVYLKIKTLSLLSAHPELDKVTVSNGTIYLYVAPNGYSNTYLLKKKNKKNDGGKKNGGLEINKAEIENIRFVFEHRERNKRFEAFAKNIDVDIDIRDNKWYIDAATDATVGQLGFNLDKGGFLKNKHLEADLKLVLNKNNGDLEIPKQEIDLDDENIILSGLFRFGARPVTYSLVIDAPAIHLKKAASFLSRNIARHFDNLDLKDPLKVFATINGKMSYPDTPIIKVQFAIKDNQLNSSAGMLTKASFSGEFNNEGINGLGHSDENSIIRFVNCSAEFEGIPVKADSVHIINLIDPVMTARIYSKFPVEKLNAIAGGSFNFTDGQADFDLVYHGPLRSQNLSPRSLKGALHIVNAGINYEPRNLSFSKCKATLEFAGEDLYMKDIVLASRRSVLYLDGSAKSFLSAYFSDPNKVAISWNVRSNLIDLNEFRSFLEPRRAAKAPSTASRNRKMKKVNAQLDALLDQGSMNLNMVVRRLTYRRFVADNIKANVDLLQSEIALRNVHVSHAGGSIDMNGSIHQNQVNNPFAVKASVKNVHIDKLFYAFENFGLESLSDKNLKGNFSADINIAGGLTETAQIIPRSFKGKVNFVLTDGALINFGPLETVKKFAFKKRNLSNITFKKLENQLDIDQGKILINPMTIESSALVVHAKGVYALDKGTDISLEIPLRNPKKDMERIAEGKAPRKGKGLTIYLRAQDGDDGKVHLAWDPLRKGDRKLDEEIFSEDAEVDEEE